MLLPCLLALQAIGVKLRYVNAQDCANLLWGLAGLGIRPGVVWRDRCVGWEAEEDRGQCLVYVM